MSRLAAESLIWSLAMLAVFSLHGVLPLFKAFRPWLIGNWWVLWLVGAIVLPMGVLAIAADIRARRFFDRVKRQDYLVCPECHYSLAGHTEGGHCPECGYEFTAESLIGDWMDILKIAHVPTPKDRT